MNDGLVLTLNAGSSSIKFAVFAAAGAMEELARGQVENLGGDAVLTIRSRGEPSRRAELGAADHAAAQKAILTHSQDLAGASRPVVGVGHRIVHGGAERAGPQVLDDAAMAALAELNPLAPLHQPHNLAAVEAARRIFPGAVQVGCFDTAFHRGHAFVEDAFALPREYYDRGIRRYGFHGVSYQFVAGELARIAPEIANGRIVVAHLGNGASMCAIKDGRSIASTMGFSTLDGLAMGTRSGQIDPGVLLYLLQQDGMDAGQLSDLLYRKSGLLGLSGFSNDMRTLEASPEPSAREAVDYFIHRIRRELGSLVAVLGGLDALVFTGGIGEHSSHVRAGVCRDFEWLGISLDAERNKEDASDIASGKVRVMVVPTDEERVIARAVLAALAG